tara:strand:+ start:2036 stop:2656 length:621 start_codon:yes stop_codon:yes gene_type:complete
MLKHIVFIIFLLLFPARAYTGNIDDLIGMLRSGDNLLRIEASEKLKKIGPSVDHQLLKLLKEEDDKVRRSIIWILGERKNRDYMKHLLPFLDENHDLSRSTIVALGKIRNPRAIPHIVKKLQSKSRYIRTDAVYSLGRIGDKSAFSHVISLKDDPDWHVREAVAMTLGNIGGQDAGKHLKTMALNDPDILVRIAAEDSLKNLKVKP